LRYKNAGCEIRLKLHFFTQKRLYWRRPTNSSSQKAENMKLENEKIAAARKLNMVHGGKIAVTKTARVKKICVHIFNFPLSVTWKIYNIGES